jgi:hypothetical protein
MTLVLGGEKREREELCGKAKIALETGVYAHNGYSMRPKVIQGLKNLTKIPFY